jgi:hypothetical protein
VIIRTGLRVVRQPAGLWDSRQLVAVQLYTRMLRLLEARGFRKAPGMTPLEFAGRVSSEWSLARLSVQSITDLYCRVRFGQAPLSNEDLQSAESLLTALRAAMR